MAQQFHDMPINHDWPQAIRDWHFVATKAADARDETSEARFTASTRTRESFANMSQMAQDARQRRLDRIDAIEYAQWQALAAIDALGAEMIAEWEQEQAEAAWLTPENAAAWRQAEAEAKAAGEDFPAAALPDSSDCCGADLISIEGPHRVHIARCTMCHQLVPLDETGREYLDDGEARRRRAANFNAVADGFASPYPSEY